MNVEILIPFIISLFKFSFHSVTFSHSLLSTSFSLIFLVAVMVRIMSIMNLQVVTMMMLVAAAGARPKIV
jgi:hypothetical protein